MSNLNSISCIYISDLLHILYDYGAFSNKENFYTYMNNIREQLADIKYKGNNKITKTKYSTSRKTFNEWMNGKRNVSAQNLNSDMVKRIFDALHSEKRSDYIALNDLLKVLNNRGFDTSSYSAIKPLRDDKYKENEELNYETFFELSNTIVMAAFHNGNNVPHGTVTPVTNNTSPDFNLETPIEKIRSELSHKLFPGNTHYSNSPIYSNENIIPRDSVTSIIQNTSSNSYKIIILTGTPGTGKSTFLLNYYKNNPEIIPASFFCKWDSCERNSLSSLIREISYQLLINNELFSRSLYKYIGSESVVSLLSMNSWELFTTIFLLPVEELHFKEPNYIIIDAIDELEESLQFINLINDSFSRLPNNLKFIISSRTSLLKHINSNYCQIIDLDNLPHKNDITAYISTRLNNQFNSLQIENVISVCGNNFLFAKYICDKLINESTSISNLPTNIEYIYYKMFQRIFSNLNYSEQHRKAFSIILASKEPLSLKHLEEILSWNHSITVSFAATIIDLIDKTKFPDAVIFYHKSVNDWLSSSRASVEYYIDPQDGINLIFDYIFRSYVNKQDIAYVILKDWDYYGKKSTNKNAFWLMSDDISFLLCCIKQHRHHSNFSKAFSAVNSISAICTPDEFVWIQINMALNDIYIDLVDSRATAHIELLLNKQALIPDEDISMKIHLLENAGWIYMQNKDYLQAENFFLSALKEYDNLPMSINKKMSYAHTLYLYSVMLYQIQKYDICKENLLISQAFISDVSDSSKSLDYSLGLKMLAWIELKNKDYFKAEQYFNEAAAIQSTITTENNLYLAHTLSCLVENELKLFRKTGKKIYYENAIKNINKSRNIYNMFDIRYQNNIIKLSNLEKEILNLETTK